MKRPLLIFAVLSLAAGLNGCRSFTAPVKPPAGILYTDYKAPLMIDYKGGSFGSKKGNSTSRYLRIPNPWVQADFAWSDAAMRSAAMEGGITTIKGADYEFLNVLGIYQQFTVYVYGD